MPAGPELTRRMLLRAGAGAGGPVALAAGGLPAWARPARSAHRLRRPDSLPFPHLPPALRTCPRSSTSSCYVSSVVQDHTSLTAFIERKWNLPP